jgi:hypothetical protein
MDPAQTGTADPAKQTAREESTIRRWALLNKTEGIVMGSRPNRPYTSGQKERRNIFSEKYLNQVPE